MQLKIGDYVEGYRMEKYHTEIQYTRGWIVDIEYEKNKLSKIMINEDITSMTEKYWPDKENKEQEYEMTHVAHMDSMYLVVGNEMYQVRKVKRQEKWWSRYFKDSEKMDEKYHNAKIYPYYVNDSILKIPGVTKVFTLNGVLQVPNSSFTEDYYGMKFGHKPVKKMMDYIRRYSTNGRRMLIIDGISRYATPRELGDYLDNKTCYDILDLFRDDFILSAKDYEDKALLVDDIANSTKNGDVLLIDSDMRIVTDIQNGKLFPDQAPNLKAVHISSFMDMKVDTCWEDKWVYGDN